MSWTHVLTIVETNLKRLYKSRDYWIPLTILASLFFVFIPLILLVLLSNSPTTPVLTQIGDVIGTLPDQVQRNIRGDAPGSRTAYAFAVYLLAPVAIITGARSGPRKQPERTVRMPDTREMIPMTGEGTSSCCSTTGGWS